MSLFALFLSLFALFILGIFFNTRAFLKIILNFQFSIFNFEFTFVLREMKKIFIIFASYYRLYAKVVCRRRPTYDFLTACAKLKI